MLRVLAFDQSITRTGYAYQGGSEPASIVCGSFSCDQGYDSRDKRERFGRRVKQLIGQYRPQIIVWEKAREFITAYPKKGGIDMLGRQPAGVTVSANQLLLPAIEGVLHGQCIAYGIVCDSVAPQTWRKAVLGNGSMTTEEAKGSAAAYCEMLKIAARNHDEAEAACLALWAPNSQIYKKLFVSMRAAR